MTAQLTVREARELQRLGPPYRCVCGRAITSENPMIASVKNGQSGRGRTRLVPVHAEICPFVDGYNVVECLGRLLELQQGE